MKIERIAILSLLIGIAAGVLAGWSQYRWREDPLPEIVAAADQSGSPAGRPKVVMVGDTTFDFGVMGRDEEGQETFRLRNDGDAPLEVDYDRASCGLCIKTTLQHASAAPGELIEIPIRWFTRKKGSDFEEYAEFFTNDPDRQCVRLTIRGFVPPSLRVDPDEISLGDISASEAVTRRVRIYAYRTDDLKILEAKPINADTAQWFGVRIEPASKEDWADAPRARAAAVAVVTTKPGLPLGPIRQTVRVTTNLAKDAVVEFAVEGRVVSDVSILGRENFKRETNQLSLGVVDRAVGAQAKLYLVVKGANRDKVRFEVERTEPQESLQASVGPPRAIGQGSVVMYPLTIEVPKNARPVNRLGAQAEQNGQVVLRVLSSKLQRIVIYVRFAVEN